jgi:tRNA dimethylallyltransferase
MFAGGLVEEARGLRERFPQWSRTASQAIGYAEALELAEGRCTRAEAEARCAAHTRRLAKRQRTWFRHQARVAWVELDGGEPIEDIADRVQGEWGHHGPVDIAGDE